MRNVATFVAGALLAIALCTPTALAARTDIQSYDLGFLGDIDQVSLCGIGGNNFGGVCFAPQPGELTVDLTISDAMQPTFSVGAYVEFQDSTQTMLNSLTFCDSMGGISIPAGTATIVVWLDGVLYSPISCGLASSVTATYGLVQADFSP